MRQRSTTSALLAAAVLATGLAFAPLAAPPARADVISLKDGQSITGTMQREGNEFIITSDNGHVTRVAPSDVLKVTLTSSLSPDKLAAAEWTRVSAQIKKTDDLSKIVKLEKDFLIKYPGLPASANAKADLTKNEALLADHPVKFRGVWMRQADVQKTLDGWEKAASRSESLYRQGRMGEARKAADAVLQDDPANPDALTVEGLAAFRMNNLAAARTAFEKLADADPGSVLAQNNLAVISFRQNAGPQGLLHYAKAIQDKPDNRLVLDNAAAALAAYKGAQDTAPYRAVTQAYAKAEPKMEREMQAQGLYRYGSTWVSKDDYTALAGRRRALQTAITQLEAQNAGTLQEVNSLASRLNDVKNQYQQTVNSLNSVSVTIAATPGNPDVPFLMSQHDTLAQTLSHLALAQAQLQQQYDAAAAKLTAYNARHDQLTQALDAMPAGGFAGAQRIMDLGEDQNPPPPAPLPAPTASAQTPAPAAPAAATSLPPPVIGPPPVGTAINEQPQFNPSLGQPINPNPGRGHDHDHDHDHNPTPTPPPATPTPTPPNTFGPMRPFY